MKRILTAIVAIAALAAAQPAKAQFQFGVTGGLNITDMKFSKEVISKENSTGFYVGPTVKFTLPVVGLGIDAAAVYDQRKFDGGAQGETVKQQFINIPINIRYSLGLGSMAAIYAAVGPQFGFNVGDKSFNVLNMAASAVSGSTPTELEGYTLKSSTLSGNISVGVSLFGHLEVKGTYNVALGKTGDYDLSKAVSTATGTVAGVVTDAMKGDLKSNAWQIGLTYFF